MEEPRSRIPRPSRLPVPRTIRPSPSKESLSLNPVAPAPAPSALVVPRLRSHASKDQLTAKPTQPRALYANSPAPNKTVARQKSRDVLRPPATRSVQPNDFAQAVGRNQSPAIVPDPVGETADVGPGGSRKPSLMERTLETLAQIPSSPVAPRTVSRTGRRTSFFNDRERPSSRTSSTSRPGSSHVNETMPPPPSRPLGSRPASRSGSHSGTALTPLKPRASLQTLKSPSQNRAVSDHSPSAFSKLPSPKISSYGDESRLRTLKPRASINGLLRKPSNTHLRAGVTADVDSRTEERIGMSPKSIPTRKITPSFHTPKRPQVARPATPTDDDEDSPTPRKSSQALRDQIAKAKAAKRSQVSKPEVPIVPQDTFDFGLSEDPFNQFADRGSQKEVMRRKIASARADGRLNIAAMGLKEIPSEVMNMYSLDSLNGASWAECVDLTRFVAADNEIEELPDAIFPDVSAAELAEDDDSQGNQFGGLETLDLHGNLLRAIPMGLRRLELLTSLNLSNNKLENSCFEVLSQVLGLRELRLANNALSGLLDERISNLSKLEVLELQRNGLTQLPENIAGLQRLRVLNVSENQLVSIPFSSLQSVPLTELYATKNKLQGALIDTEIRELPRLQTLDVMANSLSDLSLAEIRLPALLQLNCSNNRIRSLPNTSSWESLLTLFAEDNSITDLPEGFTSMHKVRTADFSGNNIRDLDNRIGSMDSLDIFRISGNPLKEKKLSGLSTEDLKKLLKGRLTPELPDPTPSEAESIYGTPFGSPTADWTVKAGGVLDRSETGSASLNPVIAANIAATSTIQVLQLHHNIFAQIPDSVAFFANTLTSLNLSHNELTSDTYLKEHLRLPALTELNLSSNTFSSLQPLIQRLEAPNLQKLDISFNRLSALPVLRTAFPSLVVLLASNNTIKELLPEAIKGFRVVDCRSNEINSLNARIGLLGGPGGLERLEVGGNRFRVPKYNILEKGTEATLAWLRDRIPASELPPAVDSSEVD